MQPTQTAAHSNQSALAQRRDPLVETLAAVLQGLFDLGNKIGTSVSTTIRSPSPDLPTLTEDLQKYLLEWKKYIDTAQDFYPKLLQKIQEIQIKGPTNTLEPILARTLLQVIILHLLGEQTMAKRFEALREIETKKREYVTYLESGLKTLHDNIKEVSSRLNLLAFMHASVEKDGVLPANVMYTANIPQLVRSPFKDLPVTQQPKPVQPPPPPQPSPTEQREEARKELERKRQLLLQLRQQQAKELEAQRK